MNNVSKFLILLFLATLLVVVTLPNVSSAEWDNTLTYENKDKTAKIKNWLGLTELGSAELKSHKTVDEKVGYGLGKNVVMWYETNFKDKYDNGFGEIEFINMRNGRVVQRDYQLMIGTEVEKDTYGCANPTATGSWDCSVITIGTKTVIEWSPYNSNDIPKGKVLIGVEIEIKPNDNLDIIFTLAGKKISKHAQVFAFMNLNDQDNAGGSVSTSEGIRVSVQSDSTLENVTIQSSPNTATKVMLYLATGSGTGTLITTADISGSTATFTNNATMVTANQYFILANNGGSSYTRTYYTAGSPQWWPVSNGQITGIKSVILGGAEFDDWTPNIRSVYSYTGSADDPPNLDLNSPIEDFNSSSASITFNGTAYDGQGITNVTLYIDSTENATNSSGFNNTFYLFDVDVEDGVHDWFMEVYDDATQINISEIRNFTVDTIDPAINILNPNGVENITNYTLSAVFTTYLNYTAEDTNLVLCDVNVDGGTNTTQTCGDNETYADLVYGGHIFNAYANDSVGHTVLDTQAQTWKAKVIQFGHTYNPFVVEGATETFIIDITTGDDWSLSSAILNYDGVDYFATTNNTAKNYTAVRVLGIPNVAVQTNKTFYWSFTLNDTTIENSSNFQQQINPITADDCSVNTELLYNFTIVDENTQSQLINNVLNTNTTGDLNLQIYLKGTQTQVINFSNSYDKVNPFAVCLDSNFSAGEEFNIDVQVQYSSVGTTGYVKEFYNIQNDTLNNADFNTTITLFDLDNVSSQEFDIFYKDASFVPVQDALIQIQRKYIGEGVFKTVEIPKTDTEGATVGHLELGDVLYTFVVVKNGVVLSTFNNVLASCDSLLTPDCTINLNAFASQITASDWITADDLAYTLTYDDSTRTVESIFTIPSGVPATMVLNGTLFDNLGNQSIGSDTLTSASGTLSFVVPTNFGNGTALVTLERNTVLVAQGSIKLKNTSSDIFGKNQIWLFLFLYLTLIGVSIGDNPMVSGFFLLIGSILAIGLNLVNSTGFVGVGATVLWLIIAIIIVLVKGSGRV